MADNGYFDEYQYYADLLGWEPDDERVNVIITHGDKTIEVF